MDNAIYYCRVLHENTSYPPGVYSVATGTNERGTWQGYMCPTPKGAPDKCDTIWVR